MRCLLVVQSGGAQYNQLCCQEGSVRHVSGCYDRLWLLNVLGCGCCCRTAAGQDGQPGIGRVLTDGTCSGLRRIHLSGLMLKDHLTDR